MIRYPVWWDQTVTIYNRYEDPQTHVVTWYRTMVDNCFWKDVGNKVTVGNAVLETNDIICRVPQQPNFLPKGEWDAKASDERGNYFTFGSLDIVVKGSVSDVISEYTDGHRATDLLEKYKALQGCLQVSRVGINVGPGRGLPHYHVKGE